MILPANEHQLDHHIVCPSRAPYLVLFLLLDLTCPVASNQPSQVVTRYELNVDLRSYDFHLGPSESGKSCHLAFQKNRVVNRDDHKRRIHPKLDLIQTPVTVALQSSSLSLVDQVLLPTFLAPTLPS